MKPESVDSPSGSPPSPEQIAQRLTASTVVIRGEFDEGNVMHDVESWMGTGIIWAKHKGSYFILSNCHVVGLWEIYKYDGIGPAKINRFNLQVVMPDGRTASPKRVMINSYLKDFAFIEVDDSIGTYSQFNTCMFEPKQGQRVYAFGHPLGLVNSFSQGVISGVRDYVSDRGASYKLIQTDASINHGNSGGPLVDEYGNLIGLNTLGMRDDGAQGINFAIAISEIKKSIEAEEFVEFPLNPTEIGPFVRAAKQTTD